MRSGRWDASGFAVQMIAFNVIFGTMPTEATGLRILRTLPLSSRRLAALLLVVPGILGAALRTSGAGSLALAISLHIASAMRLLVLERGLRRSSAFCRPRRFFGVNIGQALSAR